MHVLYRSIIDEPHLLVPRASAENTRTKTTFPPICLKLRVLEGFGNYLSAKEGGKEGADEREAGEEFLQANLSCVHGSHSPAKKNNDGICCKERHEVFGVISSPLLCIILGLHSFGLSFKLFGKVLQM